MYSRCHPTIPSCLYTCSRGFQLHHICLTSATAPRNSIIVTTIIIIIQRERSPTIPSRHAGHAATAAGWFHKWRPHIASSGSIADDDDDATESQNPTNYICRVSLLESSFRPLVPPLLCAYIHGLWLGVSLPKKASSLHWWQEDDIRQGRQSSPFEITVALHFEWARNKKARLVYYCLSEAGTGNLIGQVPDDNGVGDAEKAVALVPSLPVCECSLVQCGFRGEWRGWLEKIRSFDHLNYSQQQNTSNKTRWVDIGQ